VILFSITHSQNQISNDNILQARLLRYVEGMAQYVYPRRTYITTPIDIKNIIH
jgi:hypothetical protein